jgi:signal transduction histidine kinase
MADSLEKERDSVARLAEEHAALTRLTSLVARGTPAEELFAPIVEWAGRLLPVEFAHLGRYEADGTVTFVAASSGTGERIPVRHELIPGGRRLARMVAQTGAPAHVDGSSHGPVAIGDGRRDSGSCSLVAAPIVVEGVLWGVICGAIGGSPSPQDIDVRLASFTGLAAGAIESAAGRAALARLAEEQAALRRVATLVARAAPAQELYAAVTAEVGQLLPVQRTIMGHYEPDAKVTFLAAWSAEGSDLPTPQLFALGGRNIPTLVAQSGRPARLAGLDETSGPIARAADELGLRASSGAVGTPIVVADRLWGVMMVSADCEQPLPADTEARLTEFTELLATAIANAETRAELAASRARIVTAADEGRRRIERDLHDGAQQRLVALGLQLRAAQAAVPQELGELQGEVSRVAEGLASAQEDLREIARGIHPATLAEGGLRSALKTLARRSRVPVELDVRCQERLPDPVEVAAYYVVSEALTNADKHAHASVVRVEAQAATTTLRLDVRDDGIGGADSSRGSGLAGLKDRVEAVGGTLTLDSAVGRGTSLHVELPFEVQRLAPLRSAAG